jgi:hypothetical protein
MKFQILVMSASLAGIEAREDASGYIHVNLGPGSPCRDDESCNVHVTHTHLVAIVLHPSQIFKGDREGFR